MSANFIMPILALMGIAVLVVASYVLARRLLKQMGHGIEALLCALVILAGVAAVAFGAREFFLGRQSLRWLRTDGVVESAEMKTQRPGDASSTPAYGATVSYEYRAGAVNYTGTRLCYGDYASGGGAHAGDIIARYPPGAKVAVFYDPRDPERAVLEPGVHAGVWIPIGVGTLFLLFGTVAFYRRRTCGSNPV